MRHACILHLSHIAYKRIQPNGLVRAKQCSARAYTYGLLDTLRIRAKSARVRLRHSLSLRDMRGRGTQCRVIGAIGQRGTVWEIEARYMHGACATLEPKGRRRYTRASERRKIEFGEAIRGAPKGCF